MDENSFLFAFDFISSNNMTRDEIHVFANIFKEPKTALDIANTCEISPNRVHKAMAKLKAKKMIIVDPFLKDKSKKYGIDKNILLKVL